ncbi:hypothetical protein AN958_07556 [Leucoagaricus sp. SymC.cos]|nr:hypothetical protein AN958_07556 [Leucoagaricus sp. SymC.cos]
MLDSDHSPPSRERKVSTKAKKPPPLKKRHTKPCKFYQFGRCTNTAEECNFAHVMVLPGLSLPPTLAMSPVTGAGVYVNALGAQLCQLHVGSTPSLSPNVPAPYTGNYPYPSPYTPYPSYYAPWSPGNYGDHPGAPPIKTGAYTANNQSFNPTEAESPSVSISTSTDSSAVSRLDTPGGDGGPVGALELTGIGKYGESGMVRVLDADPSLMPSGYIFDGNGGGYPSAPPPPWDAGGMQSYSQAAGFGSGDQKVSLTRSSSRASSRSKAAKFYKTKPCKYFSIENGCPNGDSCTLHSIYDGHVNERAPQTEDAEPGDNKEKKKNFFPITWRVIGGGVLMGGKQTENSGEIGMHDPQVADTRPIEEHVENRSDGVGTVVIEKKGQTKFGIAAFRQRSRSTSTPIARPRTGSIGRGGNDNVSTL